MPPKRKKKSCNRGHGFLPASGICNTCALQDLADAGPSHEEEPQAKKRKILTCGKCFKEGHNSRSCKWIKIVTAPPTVDVPQINDAEEIILPDIDVVMAEEPIIAPAPQPPVVHAVQIICKCCYRTSTVNYPIILQLLPAQWNRRVYGSNGITPGDAVCHQCFLYLTEKKKDPKWCHGWPAFLYSVFTRKVQHIPSDRLRIFLSYVPTTVKNSYNAVVLSEGLRIVRECWLNEPKFVDITADLDNFSKDTHDGKLGSLHDSINRTGYPTIRCPMGCYIFMSNKLAAYKFIPFHHFLSQLFPKLNCFGMNNNLVRGFRPEYPKVVTELKKFKVSPSIINDAKLGLCIVGCSANIHSYAKNYVHVPQNPILLNKTPKVEDPVAPVTMNPNIVKCGATNKNTSFDVVALWGNQSGVSSFTMRHEKEALTDATQDELQAIGMVYKNRPDMFVSNQSNTRCPPNDMVDRFNLITNTSVISAIEEAKQSGNTLTMHDALLLVKSSNTRHSSDTENNSKIKVPLVLVHPTDEFGSKPIIPQYTGRAIHPTLSAAMFAVVALLANCRSLYHAFIKSSATNASRAYPDLNGLILRHNKSNVFHSTVMRKKLEKIGLNIISSLPADMNITPESSCEAIFKASMQYLLGNIIQQVDEELEMEDVLNAVDQSLILETSSRHAVADVPLSSHDNSSHLMLALSFNENNNCHFSFRWTKEHRWWNCSSLNAHSVKSNNLPALEATYFVYASPNATKCLEEADFINLYGGETALRCSKHPEFFLVREFRGSGELCSLCHLKRAFVCSYSLFPGKEGCKAGLCLKHSKILRQTEPCPTVTPRVEENDPERRPTPIDDSDDDDPNLRVQIETPVFEDDSPYDGIILDRNVAQPSSTGSTPLHRKDFGTATSGAFLLNSYLNLFSRTHINRKSPIKWAQFFSMIHSLSPGQKFPLLQPEGLLFPMIFWQSSPDGSVVGALPSAIYNDHRFPFSSKVNIASLDDHLLIRVRDGSLLTSTSANYLCFLFDIKLNKMLNHCYLETAFKKGLEHLVSQTRGICTENTTIQFDEIDSNILARNLAAMNRSITWTYFATFTCNDLETMGVAPIRQAIDELHRPGSPEWHDELQRHCNILTRCWHRTIEYFLEFIEKNPIIFGSVKRFVARLEHQSNGAPGNKAHVHCGITLTPGVSTDKQNLERIYNRLEGAFSLCFNTHESQLREQGLVKTAADMQKFKDNFTMLQQHICINRCCVARPDGVRRCRHKVHPVSFHYSYQAFPDVYAPVFNILQELKLTQYNNIGREEVIDLLKPGQYHYPTEPFSDRVPTIPLLQVALSSQTDVQHCDRRTAAAYVAKYASKFDEKQHVLAKKKGNEVEMDVLPPFGEATYSVRNAELKLREKKKQAEPFCKAVSLSEVCLFNNNLPYFITNVEFVNIPTQCLEDRAGVLKMNNQGKKIIGDGNVVLPVEARKDYPPERQFTQDQITLMIDFAESPYLVDKTSSYGLRPPELMHCDRLEPYLLYFTRLPVKKYLSSLNFFDCPWIDGACQQVRVRIYYLLEVSQFFQDRFRHSLPSSVTIGMIELMDALCAEVNSEDHSDLFRRFVDTSAKKEGIPVFSLVTPKCFPKFLYHLILSMGTYQTELDFFGMTLLDALKKSGLLPNSTAESAKELCKRYVCEQMHCLPISSKQFNRFLPLIYKGLINLVTNENLEVARVPLQTQRAIRQSAIERLEAYECNNLQNILKALQYDNPSVAELKDDILAGRDVASNVSIVQAEGQSVSSVEEQSRALEVCKSAIDQYFQPATKFVQSVILAGPPGAGKTYIFQKAIIHSLCHKAKAVVTSITSERSRVLGGEHVHYLFAIPVTKNKLETSSSLAIKTLANLGNYPIRSAFLKRIDVIFFEEIGLLSSSMLSVIDIVLRSIRDVEAPFGGVLIIATGDNEQLSPVSGSSMFRSTHLVTTFKVCLLSQMVRARGDAQLQLVITDLRRHDTTAQEKDNIVDILRARCRAKCVASFNDVPQGVLSIVGTRAAVEEANSKRIKQQLSLVRDPARQVRIVEATDTVEKGVNNWYPADNNVKNKLDYHCLEIRKLYLFLGSIMRLCFNNSSPSANMPRFSQGQLAIITKLPENDEDSVEVRLMPPGSRQLATLDDIPDDWVRCLLPKKNTIPMIVASGMQKARRFQYPLRYNTCCTVHKAIGETCHAIATQINRSNIYKLWDRNQLLVILSRVTTLDNIYFVGEFDDTMLAIRELLNKANRLQQLQSECLTKQNCLNDDAIGVLPPTRSLSFQQLECDVASVDIGFVFIAVSSNDYDHIIIDHCVNIRQKMHELNTPTVNFDYDHTPYILIAYFCGFHGVDVNSQNNRNGRQQLSNYMNNILQRNRGNDLVTLMHQWQSGYEKFKHDNYLLYDVMRDVRMKICFLITRTN